MNTPARHTLFGIVLGCLLAISGEACSRDPEPAQPGPANPPAPSGRVVVSGTAAPGSIVTLEPATPREFPAPVDIQVMDQFGQQFLPPVLVVQVGQRVDFRSSEDVMHNVRVEEAGTHTPVFNVASMPFASYPHVFDKAGYYNVSCDIHPSMHANILVAATPYSALADTSGKFSISGVEAGRYTARAFSGAEPTERAVEVAPPRTEVAFGSRR